jgi:predicted RNase H-like HicB family nuclease
MMKNPMAMMYWKGDKGWMGRLVEHPEITARGRTRKELEENIARAYQQMMSGRVPQEAIATPYSASARDPQPLKPAQQFPILRWAPGTPRRKTLLARIRAGVRRLLPLP